METEIFRWNNYACNNSSDVRLVAKFSTKETAISMFEESTTFFRELEQKHDPSTRDEFGPPGELAEIATRFGNRFGHEWEDFTLWGSAILGGEPPDVAVLGTHLVFYHTYSISYGVDFPKVLESAGAESIVENIGPPTLYVECTFDEPTLLDELAPLFRQREETLMEECAVPWSGEKIDVGTESLRFVGHDEGCRFTLPLPLQDYERFRAYLTSQNVTDLRIRIATDADLEELKHDDA